MPSCAKIWSATISFSELRLGCLILKYGSLQQAAFREPAEKRFGAGSTAVRTALLRAGVPGRRGVGNRLVDDLASGACDGFDRARSDNDSRADENLGGHDCRLSSGLQQIVTIVRPYSIAYTAKALASVRLPHYNLPG